MSFFFLFLFLFIDRFRGLVSSRILLINADSSVVSNTIAISLNNVLFLGWRRRDLLEDQSTILSNAPLLVLRDGSLSLTCAVSLTRNLLGIQR